MESIPLVSVIITTKNRCELLQRAVESVQAQTYSNIELIIVDDGSTDSTGSWCRKQAFNYIFIPPQHSVNGNYARNLGLKASKGKFVAFLDDDDAWLPNKIEKQVELMSEECKVVYTLRRFEVINQRKILYFNERYHKDWTGDIAKKILTVECVTSTSTILFEKKFLLEVGGWDENQEAWQDNELLIRCAHCLPIFCVPEPLTLYRIDNSGNHKISNNFNKWKKSAHRLYTKHKELYKELNWISKYKVLSIYFSTCAVKSWKAKLKVKSIGYHMIAYVLNPLLLVKQVVWFFKNKIG